MAKKTPPKEDKPPLPEGLDRYDWEILKMLQGNAKLTVKEIAQGVNLSTTPVHERIKKMESSGVIKQYVAIIDNARVRKGLIVICYVSLKEHGKQAGSRFIRAVQQLPEVIECYSISGEFDFMLKVIEENMETYYDFHVNKLGQIENMGNIQSVFVMGIVKQKYDMVF